MPNVAIDELLAVYAPEVAREQVDLLLEDFGFPVVEDLALAVAANGTLETYLPHFSTIGVFERPNVSMRLLKGGACSTAPARGLSLQIERVFEQLGGSLVRFVDARVLSTDPLGAPFFQPGIADAISAMLNDPAAQKTECQFHIVSGWRSLAQQYILANCGNGNVTSTPGRSPHMKGTGLDVRGAYGTADRCNAARNLLDTPATVLERAHPVWGAPLEKYKFQWFGSNKTNSMCGDPPHFDNVGNPAVELRPIGVRAFERLWNNNNPCDKIDEDGVYDADTEERLTRSPSGGFDPQYVTEPLLETSEGIEGGGCPNPKTPPKATQVLQARRRRPEMPPVVQASHV